MSFQVLFTGFFFVEKLSIRSGHVGLRIEVIREEEEERIERERETFYLFMIGHQF